MTVTPAVFASGELPNTDTNVYTVPGATQAIIAFMTFHNKSGSSQEVRVYFRVSGTDRVIVDITLAAGTSFFLSERPVLASGYILRVGSDNASSVDYYISGVEIT